MMVRRNLTAFTLIEAIIAIAVFCTWILVVLHGLSQTLRNQDYANVQITSSFLAREWIELMFNLRDANYHKELPWNCVFKSVNSLRNSYRENDNPFCGWYLWSWSVNVLKISIWLWGNYVYVETGNISDDFDDNFNNYQIYLHTWNVMGNQTGFVYDYTWSEEEKIWFARYLVITWIVENGELIDKDKILKLESHVLYKRWELTWEKIMETFIWNYEF